MVVVMRTCYKCGDELPVGNLKYCGKCVDELLENGKNES
jgi:hypothetical protein